MTNQHASTDKSTTHSDRRYSQPAGDQGAGAERTYFYAHSKLQQKARKNDARFQGHLPLQALDFKFCENLELNDPSKPSHCWTNGPLLLKTIEANG